MGFYDGRTVAAFVAVTALASLLVTAADDYDLSGDYCSIRGCCTNRQDECSMPVLGTLCYCDNFCDHLNKSSDCCPDYWSVCRGNDPLKMTTPRSISLPTSPKTNYHEPHPELYTEEQNCKRGESFNINCNKCTCKEIDGKTELLCNDDKCLIDSSLLDLLNNQRNRFGWSAKNYSEFWGKKYKDGLTLRLGTLESPEKILQIDSLKIAIQQESLETSFDLREVWGDAISQPMDQGWCAASWAITTVQVIADRFGVMSKGAIKHSLSAQHLLSCDNHGQHGCGGGHLISAWNWIRKFGIVTEECYPWEGRTTNNCAVAKKRKESTARCPSSMDPSVLVQSVQLRRVGQLYRIATEKEIMYEIKNWGSVQAMMRVSKEFFMYKSGVYKCSDLYDASKPAYHTVRIVGWGENNDYGRQIKYWIVSNSWGRWWGEDGYFRILKGRNECQIEEFVIASKPDVDNFNL